MSERAAPSTHKTWPFGRATVHRSQRRMQSFLGTLPSAQNRNVQISGAPPALGPFVRLFGGGSLVDALLHLAYPSPLSIFRVDHPVSHKIVDAFTHLVL